MSSIHEPRNIIRTIEPRNCDPVEVICGQSELTEVLTAAIATGQHIVSVQEFWSMADEQAACEECEVRELEGAF